ncbi:MAG: peptidylprolyl isomerase [Candidatus Sericytochromatia bacterium]|nr:peptidylprolyl isomerase [Candidatus Tanganyikabacteria bacterium]
MNEKTNNKDNEAKLDPQAAIRARNATKKAVAGLVAAVVVASGAAVATFYVTEADAWVGTVNGEKIDRDSFERNMAVRKKQYESRMGVDFSAPQGQQMLDNLRKDVVDQLVERSVLLQGAQKRKIGAEAAEVETRLKSIKTQFPDEAAFKKALQENGITQEALAEQVRDSLIVEKLRDDLTKTATVSPDEARKFYDGNPEHFKVAEEVKASHILVKTEQEAKDLVKRIKGGADFGDLARKHSEDSGSKAQGGDLGFFGKGRMVPEFEAAAFALGPGGVSAPVKSQFGWHVIKAHERRQAHTKKFDDIKGEIGNQLLRQKKDKEFAAWLESERGAAKVVIRPQYQPPPPRSSQGTESVGAGAFKAHGSSGATGSP